MKKKRLPRAGERVKVGRRLVTLPGVPSMTDADPVASETKRAEKPADQPSEELTRTIKAAYQ